MTGKTASRLRTLALAAALTAAAMSGAGLNAFGQTTKPAANPQKQEGEKKPQPERPPPPYEARLLRLSEIMGALSFLQNLCGDEQGAEWRASMQQLLAVEAKTPSQRARLAGAFNAGFRGFAQTYRTCTDNARLVIARYLTEGELIARDVASRYSGG